MGTFNIGPCECCGDGGGFETCDDCVDNASGILATLSDFEDCVNGTLEVLRSNMNGSFNTTTLVSSGAGTKTFSLDLGTQGDCGDRGRLIYRNTSGGTIIETYVWQVQNTVRCVSGDPLFGLVGLTHRFDVTGGGCSSLGPTGAFSSSGLGDDAGGSFEDICNDGESATGSRVDVGNCLETEQYEFELQ